MESDRGQIENLLTVYCERYDAGDFEGYAALFAHGTVGGPTGSFSSPAEIVAYHNNNCLLYDGSPRTRHVTNNLFIEVADDGRNAIARSYVTIYQSAPGFPLQVIFVGQYIDKLHKIDRRWWFRERVAVPHLVGDLSYHAREYISSTS